MEHLTEEQFDYQRIAESIEYISKKHLCQPGLDEIAEAIGISPFHFQKMFTRWAGVSPKKFLQFTTLNYSKELLKQQATLADVAEESGLSGTGRLHDLFVKMEAMRPGDYKNGGAELFIRYKWMNTVFGQVLIARTDIGICHLQFDTDFKKALSILQDKFPNAKFNKEDHHSFSDTLQILSGKNVADTLPLHIKGTPFQVKVWEALLKIPPGYLRSYGELANELGSAKASRAVGTAIGKNPVAVLIPCHRVIQATGVLGGYHWGLTRKKMIIAREAAMVEGRENNPF